MTCSRESPPPEDFETEFGNPFRLPRTYVSLRATDPVHRRADNRHVTIHQRSAALLKELAQRVYTVLGPAQNKSSSKNGRLRTIWRRWERRDH